MPEESFQILDIMFDFTSKTLEALSSGWNITPGQHPVCTRVGKLSHWASWLGHRSVSPKGLSGWQVNEFWICPKTAVIWAGLSRWGIFTVMSGGLPYLITVNQADLQGDNFLEGTAMLTRFTLLMKHTALPSDYLPSHMGRKV